MQRKGLVLYEPIGWLSASELDLLKKLKIDPSLYLNKDVYFNESKQIKWIGELEDKLPDGEGVFLLHDLRKVVIVVEAKAGQKDGYGKVYLEDGSYYEVQFRKDDCDGISDYFAANGQKILTANFNHDKLVELRYAKTGEVYLGEHSFLMRHGRGKQFKDASQTMESIISNGIFENDKFVKGYAKHEYYVGDLDQGVYQGHGTLYYDRGYKRKLMAGTFKNGKLDGWGQEFFENDENDLKYEGNFVEGVYEGDGSLMVLEPEKRIYRGKFRNGEPQLQFDILDQEQRVLQKVTYKNGKIIEILEDYMYNVKLPSTQEITEDEVNAGEVETQVMAKVVYARQLSSVRYYRNIKDENPYYMMQVDPKLFNIKYEGIVNRKGSLIYSGDMRNILFEGKGTLRYAAKNEPRKYVGTFVNGLFDGTGELYLLNNQILYIGQFKQNKFHGAGKLTIHSIFLTGTEEMTAQQLKAGTFGADRYDVEVEGQFSEGKFSNGVWMYTGVSEAVMDRVLAMKVEKQTKDKIEGKMYERKVLVYEGTFFHYSFDGKGVLYYKDGVQKKYEGGFKNGTFEGFGQLYDRKGKLVYAGDFSSGSYNGKGKLYQGFEENLIYEGELKDGRVMGQGKMLESDGKTLRSEGYYQDCVLTEGYVKIYSQVNKKILYEGSVKDGLYDGTGVLYNSAGEACVKGTFKKGDLIDGIKKEFHNDGSLKREGHVKHGNYEGHVKEFFYDGKVMFEGDYKNGERNGEGIAYHRNGQPKQKGIFKDNVFYDGDAMYYFEDNVTKMFVGKIKNMYYNGHGIRYFENGALEYEGTFKNGLYDGDGIYYYFEEPGRIKFKGKFGDGRPDGEGEYYDLSGRLIFKGKFVNWRKEGPGILYSSTGEKIMEGTFDDDRLYQGYGKILWPGFGTVKYEGEFSGGYQEGKGKTFFTNNFKEYEGDFKGNYFDGYGVLYSEHEEGAKVYDGHFSKGKYHGSGIHYGKEEIYDGEYKQGKKFGEGVLKYRDPNLGVIFEGKFESDDMIDGHANIRDPKTKTLLYSGGMKKGKYDGQAVKYFKDGKKEYEGTFKYGLFDGHGTKYNEDGTKEYEGEYIRGVITGDGKIYQNGVLRYDGKTLKGIYHGTGTLYDEDGKVIYKGSFTNGKYDGKGALYHPRSSHLKYEGNFADGLPQGFGRRYNKNGELKYEGNFENGKYQGEGILYYPDTGIKKYEGTFNQKVADGTGKFYGPEGNKLYEGDVLNGVYQGNGVLYYEEFPDKPYYEGEFQNGVPHGMGLFKYSNEVLQYQGEVNNGTYHGKGTYYHADGKVKANGSFINGKYNAP